MGCNTFYKSAFNEINVDAGTRILVESHYGSNVEARLADDIFSLLDMDAEPDEIKASLAFCRELPTSWNVDHISGAERIAESVHDALGELPDKPLKKDLQEFVKTVRQTIEHSSWEY